MSYWDTSCLVKLYTPETDSVQVSRHLATSAGGCVTSKLTPLEFWATVRRKEAEGILAPGEAATVRKALDSDVSDGLITVVGCNSSVRELFRVFVEQCYAQAPPIFLRTADAIHLATARYVSEQEVVTTDIRMREAALALGFSVFPE